MSSRLRSVVPAAPDTMERCAEIVEIVKEKGLVRSDEVLSSSGKFPGCMRAAAIGLRRLEIQGSGIDTHGFYSLFRPDIRSSALYFFAEFDERVASSIAEMVRQPATPDRMKSLKWRLKSAGLQKDEIEMVASHVSRTAANLGSGGP